ncbi:hypothetical protein [Streptomyces avermitilis]|uniref:hypothetical protein n=1 Tax=Streptomyces avermitilis TaxID=33903 RepID=UPI0037103CB6
MTDKIPDPPNYPPFSAGCAPTEVHVHLTAEQPEESRWDFRWLQLGRNTKCLLVSVITAPWWAGALRDVRESQHQPGAWFMAGAAFCVALWLDRTRQRFATRVLVWTTALGAVGALPVFSAFVRMMAGSPA